MSEETQTIEEEFFNAYTRDRDRLFGYIFTLVQHAADAEDVFQRCSLLLWRKFPEYDRDRPFLPWACGIAYFEVRNFMRSHRRDRLQFNDELIAQLSADRLQATAETDRRLEALRMCLRELKRDDQELIDLTYAHDWTLRDTAKTNGRASQTIYNRICLIRRRLHSCVLRRLAT